MWRFVHHYIYQDLWVPTWPNWFAGAVAAALAYLIGRVIIKDIKAHMDRNHEALKKHITATVKEKKCI